MSELNVAVILEKIQSRKCDILCLTMYYHLVHFKNSIYLPCMYVILSDEIIFKISVIKKVPILIHSQRDGPQKEISVPNGRYIFST